GQGYALARPMPMEALPDWLANQQYHGSRAVPKTALGALAGELRWEEQLVALPADPEFWARHAQPNCGPGEYLHREERAPACAAMHETMHAAAMAGPSDPLYRRERHAFLALLTEHVLGEERV